MVEEEKRKTTSKTKDTPVKGNCLFGSKPATALFWLIVTVAGILVGVAAVGAVTFILLTR